MANHQTRAARVTAEQQNFSDSTADFDLYLYMANVKTHLADHQPMDRGDEDAWRIAHLLQYLLEGNVAQ